MKPGDEELMAYVDGELDPAGIARVEAAMAGDPAVAAAVANAQALRDRLREAFNPVLDEPVPGHLLALARGEAAPGGATMHALPVPVRRRWGMPEWSALAAALVLGIAVSQLLLRPDAEPVRTDGDGLIAAGELARALESRLAAETDRELQVGLSFRSRDGNYCRSFRLEGERALSGLGCREGDGDWQVLVLVGSDTGPGGGLRQASSALPPAIVSEVQARMAGEPLDAAEERAARDAGWR